VRDVVALVDDNGVVDGEGVVARAELRMANARAN